MDSLFLPYLDGPKLEHLDADGRSVRFLWLVPVTPQEVRYKKEHGLDALERRFEDSRFNYADANRESTV